MSEHIARSPQAPGYSGAGPTDAHAILALAKVAPLEPGSTVLVKTAGGPKRGYVYQGGGRVRRETAQEFCARFSEPDWTAY